jgi:hypothetical protein
MVMIKHSTVQATFAAKAKQSHWAAMFSTCSYVGAWLKICHVFGAFYLQSRFLALFFEGEGGVLIIICTRDDQG